MSVGFDLIATILSGGFSTLEIGERFEDEYGLSQILIAIDHSKFNTTEVSDDIVNRVIEDLKKSEPAEENTKIRYPGERVISVRKDNLLNGIPVVDEIWERIKNM
ncbi:Ldh family oxidoreductase [Anaerosalibacter bizertensis]|uniref:Ldh family oxidoreductase n=1 Tax=Anaerosalibacter bizertensis TaxID=932217 RepID=A0A9Q4FME3_9FIRM|nr:Ldh family oxidoreductase [Anaerosalibacter bizertensis]MBV1819451.1 Ldh family oxidoreductase [Bacteroidales bacterium MSK.15.36]MCB5560178.1 Ldh family oxidoreductase [Anaerosalibacter bizertensis]MCG4565838.1 Ldh family oxidoreductase [Anaerosalibacter bizertensis]MCG4583118.1 Ldh family oxidoreductase [Anaerosalibacter bizertensis]